MNYQSIVQKGNELWINGKKVEQPKSLFFKNNVVQINGKTYINGTFSDDELGNMGLWIDSSNTIKSILVEDDDIVLITDEADLRINGMEEH